jgi:hypothetical protein
VATLSSPPNYPGDGAYPRGIALSGTDILVGTNDSLILEYTTAGAPVGTGTFLSTPDPYEFIQGIAVVSVPEPTGAKGTLLGLCIIAGLWRLGRKKSSPAGYRNMRRRCG